MKLRGITEVCMGFLFPAAQIFVSAGVSYFSIEVYRRLPAVWLCEYNELPGEEHAPENRCGNRIAAFFILWISCTVLHFLTFRKNYCIGEAAYREFFLLAWFIILVTAALSDMDYMIIPDQCCAAAAVSAVIRTTAGIFYGSDGADLPAIFVPAAGGTVLAGILMAASMLLGRAAARAESIGMGDLKLFAACGACVGACFPKTWPDAVLVFFVLAVMLNAVWSAVMILLRRTEYGGSLPFGPWIAAAALFCVSLG